MPGWITTVRLVTYAIYFIIGLTGAFTKDIYDVLTERIIKIQIRKVVLGGTVTAALMPFVESLLFTRLSPEAFLALGFLCGALSFELFGKLSSITGIKNIARDAIEIREILKERKVGQPDDVERDVYKEVGEIITRPDPVKPLDTGLIPTDSTNPDANKHPPDDDDGVGPSGL